MVNTVASLARIRLLVTIAVTGGVGPMLVELSVVEQRDHAVMEVSWSGTG